MTTRHAKLLKTLKREEIHATTHRDFEDLQKRLEEFIERCYNQCRLHSALDRIDAHGATCGDVAGDQGNGNQNERDGHKRQRISRTNPV